MKILSKNEDSDLKTRPSISDLNSKIKNLESVISDHESAIMILTDTINRYSIINEQLCREMSLVGRWAASVSNYVDEEKEDLVNTFGLDIDDDDEYLN
tara:strand:- start:448 stop:741 length:294 start_codon:yes stop_codon:yes gene_type:complete